MIHIKIKYLNLSAFAICCVLMGFAAYLQLVKEIEPCALCVLQRILVIVLGLAFLGGALLHLQRHWIKIYGGLIFFIATLGALVAGRQVWLQNLPADEKPGCGPGLNYLLDNFPLGDTILYMFKGTADCAQVVWTFLGLSIPSWTLFSFILFAGLALWEICAEQE